MGRHSARWSGGNRRSIVLVAIAVLLLCLGAGLRAARPRPAGDGSPRESSRIGGAEPKSADAPISAFPIRSGARATTGRSGPADDSRVILEKAHGRRDWKKHLARFDLPNEIVGRRDAYARHFRNPDGSLTALLSVSPIHYCGDDGSWLPIDTEIRPLGAGYANLTNTLQSRFPARANSAEGTRIGLDQDRSYSWVPQSAGYTTSTGSYVEAWRAGSVSATADEEEIRYEGIFPSATDRYRVHAGVVKHDLVLDAPPEIREDAASFDYVGRVELGQDLAFFVDGRKQQGDFITSNSIWVGTAAGEKLFRIGLPLAVEDRGGKRVLGAYAVRSLGAGRYEMSIRVPAAWLLDPKRAYPVRIDPTTWQAAGVQVANSYFYGGFTNDEFYSSWGNTETSQYWADGSYGGSQWYDCAIGRDYDWAVEFYRSSGHWNTSSIPDTATVTKTELQIYTVISYNYADFDTGDLDVNAFNMANQWYDLAASTHYNDCADGPQYLDSVNLYAGQGYTSWFDLGATANSTVQSQLASNWFGVGFTWESEGDRGVLTYLDFSTLRVKYNMKPTAPALVSPADGARSVGNSVTLDWNASTDGDGDALTYYLYVGTSDPPPFLTTTASTAYTWTGPLDATTYYWRVRAYDGVTFSDYSATRWFRENGLASIPANVTPANGTFVQPGSGQTVAWSSVTDPDGDVVTYEWRVDVDNPPSVPYSASGSTTGTTSTSFTTTDGALYYWNARVWDGYEYTSYSTVTSFGADGTAPSATGATVNDGTGGDIDWQTTMTSLSANWSGFTDTFSGVASYDWAIGTTSGGTEVMSWTNVGAVTSATKTGLSLSNGQTYYVSVRARDGADNPSVSVTSDGVTVDSTAPDATAAVVNDGPPPGDIDATTSATAIEANWSGFSDPESGIASYEWAIGSAPGSANVQGWTNVGAATSASNSSLNLTNGTTYYVGVRAKNFAGATGAEKWSDGVLVDLTGPTPGTVNDGAGADIDWQATNNALSANWSGFSDPQGVSGYQVAIGTSTGGTDVLNWTAVGAVTSYTYTPGGTIADGLYYFSVRGIDGNVPGNIGAPASSDGVTIDSTGPQPGTVNDGAGADVDVWTDAAQLSANWSGFTDGASGSGIQFYEWAIGTTAGGAEVMPWTNVGLSTSQTKTGLGLSENVAYYVSVRATDNQNNLGPVKTSDGVTIDTLPPTPGTVYDGSTPGVDAAWQTSTSSLSANWSGFSDSGSGIASYQWAIGTSPGGTDVLGWTSVGLDTSATANSLPLSEGATYYVSVRARDQANLYSDAYSDGVTVDATLPGGAVTVNSGDAWTATESVTLSLSASDALSGVSQMRFSNDGASWSGWEPYATTKTWTLSSGDGAKTVYAEFRDTAGNVGPAPAASDAINLDKTGPSAGTVNDGTGADVDFQTSTTTISANWSGFTDSGVGIASYEWAIGTTSGGTNIQGWTNVGAATSASNSSLSLSDGTYFVSVRAIDGLDNVGGVATSDGVTVDTAGPTAGTVYDGLGADIDWQNSTTTISVNWSGFSDAGGIASYQWAIGTSPGGTDVQGWTGSGITGTTATNSTLALTDGVSYYVSVRAIDGMGNVGTAGASDGVTVDATSPAAPTLLAPANGSMTGPHPLLQWSGDAATYEVDVDGTISTTSEVNYLAGPLVDGLHSWRVRGIDEAGNVGPWSSTWFLTADAIPPTVPTLVSPADAATTTVNPTFLDWTDSTDANGIAGYDVEVYSGGELVYSASSVGSSLSSSLPDGTFTWRVRAVDVHGNVSAWTASFSFTKSSGLAGSGPTAPTPVAPDDGATVADPVTCEWLASTDDTGVAYYFVEVDGSGTPAYFNATTSGLSVTFSVSSGSYTWHVRAVDVDGNPGPWSPVRGFVVPSEAPGPVGTPTLLLPPNGSALPPGPVSLNWTDVAGATSYEAQVLAGAVVVDSAAVSSSAHTTPVLGAGTYAWRARAVGPAGPGAWTDAWTFTVSAGATADSTPPSTAPSNPSPADGATGLIDPEVALSWSASADPESGIAYYLVEVFDAGAALVFSGEVPAPTTTVTTTLLADGTYTWTVTAFNGQGGSTTGAVWSFTVDVTQDTQAPSVVVLQLPSDGSQGGPGTWTFQWFEAADNGAISSYEFQLDTDAAFATPVAWWQQLAGTQTSISLSPGAYYWRVRAVDAAGNKGGWSAAWSVTIGSPPAVAVNGGGSSGGCTASFTSYGYPGGACGVAFLWLLLWALARRKRTPWSTILSTGFGGGPATRRTRKGRT